MALLSGLAARTVQELQCVTESADVTQIEARVGALCSLMQQAATRLCPAAAAAATDAALALLSGLQSARLRLPAGSPAAVALERSMQHLLHRLQQGLAPPTPALLSPAAGAAAPQPTTDGSSQRGELGSFVQALGFSTHDWQAAQSELSQRTAAALGAAPASSGTGGSTAQVACAAAGNAASLEPQTPLDSLLQTAVSSPAWHPGSGEPSLLHSTVAEVLWVLRQFPSPADLPPERQPQLSPEGWAAYWVLEPQALQQALAELLLVATQQPGGGQQQAPRVQRQQGPGSIPPGSSSWLADLRHLLDSKPHWAAATTAVVQHPALHLLSRQTLHSWLLASGNPTAWRLLLHFMQAACSSSGGGAQLLLNGQLPVQLRVLYPPGLAAAAALLHTQPPSETGLCTVVGMLQRFLAGEPSEAAGTAGAAVELAAAERAATGAVVAVELPAVAEPSAMQHCLASDPAAWAAAAAQRRQQVWQLQLDAPSWLLFCLRQLPLQQLLDLAAQEVGEGGGPGSRAAGPATPPGAAVERSQHNQHCPGSQGPEGGQPSAQQQPPLHAAASPAAARYAALALWHAEPLSQAVLEEALQLQLGDIDLEAVWPWLQALHGWQEMLAAVEPAEAAGVGGQAAEVAAAAQQQEQAGAADMEVEADDGLL